MKKVLFLALLLVSAPVLARAQELLFQPGASAGGQAPCNAFGSTAGTCAQGILFDARSSGAKFDGATDDTVAIQAVELACFTAGGGTIQWPRGTTVLSGLNLRPLCRNIGSGVEATIVLCNASPCITQDTTESLPGIALANIGFKPQNAGNNSDVVINLTSVQQSQIGPLLIKGFATSTSPISIGGTVPSTIRDTTLGGNVVYNTFRDINIQGAAGCILLQGAYTGSPPTVVTQVLTRNTFIGSSFFNVSGKCIDIVKAADSNVFVDILITMNADASTAIVQGDDSNFSTPTNVYVNNNLFIGPQFSTDTGSRTVTYFGGYNGWGTEAYGVKQDQNTNPTGGNATVVDSVNFPCSYRLQGQNLTGFFGAGTAALNLDTLKCGVVWEKSATLSSPSNGFTWVTPLGTEVGIISGSGTIATGTIQLPCQVPDNKRILYTTTALTISSVTVQGCSGAGASLYGPTTYILSPSSPIAFYRVGSSNSWLAAGGALSTAQQVLSSGSGTISQVPNSTYLNLELWGGGGGGADGFACGAAASCGGGGGGGGGGHAKSGPMSWSAMGITSCAYVVGAGGTHNSGVAGATTTVTCGAIVVSCFGGGAGSQGAASTASGGGGGGTCVQAGVSASGAAGGAAAIGGAGAGGSGLGGGTASPWAGAGGGGSSNVGLAGAGGHVNSGASGGAAGGGCNAGATTSAQSGGINEIGRAGAATAGLTLSGFSGTGGGGGAASTGAAGAAGGVGGLPGAGGGGGGNGCNGTGTASAGGNGGSGQIIAVQQ